jgi:hypothetical protein
MRLRNTLFGFLGILFLAGAAAANTTPSANCTPFPAIFTSGVGGPTPVSCPPFTVPGATLTAVTLTFVGDYQFGTTATNTVQITFLPAGPAGVTWSPASVTLTDTGGASSGTEPMGTSNAASGISTAAFAAAFNVNVSSVVTQGGVADSSGAVSVVYTYNPPPALVVTCPATTGTVGTPYSSALVATGGVPPYTYSITGGSLPPGLTLNPSTGAITGTPTTAGASSFTAHVVDSTGTGADGTSACTITISPTPPPPTGNCNNSAATVVFPAAGTPLPEGAFLIRYVANLDQGDSFINITNDGLNGAPLQGPGFGSQAGDICVNVYTFSPDEQLEACCSCPVTPNALASFSVNIDLLGTTLTPVKPTSAIIKLVGSLPGTNTLAGGVLAWATTLHLAPPVGEAPALAATETPFTPGTLSAAELTSITGRCASNIANGSGFGICAVCRNTGLGAAKK